VQDPFVRVHKSEILLRFPVSIAEAARVKELRVPTVGASMVVRMKSPDGRGNHIRLVGKGLAQPGSSVLADMLVFPLIALPKTISPLVQAAIDTIEASYNEPVRTLFDQDPACSEFLFRSDDNAVLMFPISVGEALRGVQTSITLLGSNLPIRVPAPWTAGKDITMQGALVGEDGTVGDLVVVPYIALPSTMTNDILGAADSIEAAYTSTIRAELPGRLPSPG
jgi:DnaJ-class molecular chaperone